MENITFYQPGILDFGPGSLDRFIKYLQASVLRRLYILTVPFHRESLEQSFRSQLDSNVAILVNDGLQHEPGLQDFYHVTGEAKTFAPDAIIGIGGGSVLDLSKLVAALLYNDQQVEEVFGIGRLKNRSLFLACLPTTSGTGSEVSPNAILMDERDNMKKGIISSCLVPDYACFDPLLTIGVPPEITAATGLDALTHCIEAFANKFAHPMVDLYALEGIRLIGGNLLTACQNGNDIAARTALSMGSYYGGLCLGPVNTAAVHALSYPLGSQFKVAHGLANAMLLPWVMEFNLPAATDRYSRIAIALGAENQQDSSLTAAEGVRIIRELIYRCKLPSRLSEIGIPEEVIEAMATSAVAIERLMKNNVREMTVDQAVEIYIKAY